MLETFYIPILIGGFLGGFVRGLVGYIKYKSSYKNVAFDFWYFASMVGISGVIGLLTVIVIRDMGVSFMGISPDSPGLSFVVGYAGGDFLENVYKIVIKKPTIYAKG